MTAPGPATTQPVMLGEGVICTGCGTHYPLSPAPPAHCRICEDEREFIAPAGQQWTTLPALRWEHHNLFETMEPGVTRIVTAPHFAIGQRAYLVETDAGNLLWETVSLIDHETIAEITRRGGIAAIAISHPHFYTTMLEWSRAFGDAPIYLHADNQPWVVQPGPAVHYWSEESLTPLPGLTIVRCGGHFPGSAVLHWRDGASGTGALFTGDTIQIARDRRWVSFMYSYPNLIPLDAASVTGIVAAVEPYPFDRLYGAFEGNVVATNAREIVRRSAERYIAHLRGANRKTP